MKTHSPDLRSLIKQVKILLETRTSMPDRDGLAIFMRLEIKASVDHAGLSEHLKLSAIDSLSNLKGLLM